MNRKLERHRRVDLLIKGFERYLRAFEEQPAFRRQGQYEYHAATIQRRREIGDAAAAVHDQSFLTLLYQTLQAWGIDQRGSRLKDFTEFAKALSMCAPVLPHLDGCSIDSIDLDTDDTASLVWDLVESLPIVENQAKLVPCSKALHHVLPDLVVPVDRQYTRSFFAWHVPEFQYNQKAIFLHDFEWLAGIARQVNPARYVGVGWNTSRTKVLDNALVGFCKVENVPLPS
jgi:hypothetical protein